MKFLIYNIPLGIILYFLKEIHMLFLKEFVFNFNYDHFLCQTNQNPIIEIMTTAGGFKFHHIDGLLAMTYNYNVFDIRKSSIVYNYGANYYLVCGKNLLTLIDPQGVSLQEFGDSTNTLNTLYKASPMCSFCKSSKPDEYLIAFVSEQNLKLLIVSSDLAGTSNILEKRLLNVDTSSSYQYDYFDCIEINTKSINYFCLYAFTTPTPEQHLQGIYYDEVYIETKFSIAKKYSIIKRIDDNIIKKQEYFVFFNNQIDLLIINGTETNEYLVYGQFSDAIIDFEVADLNEKDPIIIAAGGLYYFILFYRVKMPTTYITKLIYQYDYQQNNLSLRSLSNDYSKHFYLYAKLLNSSHISYSIQFPLCLSSLNEIQVIPGEIYPMSNLNYDYTLFFDKPFFFLVKGRTLSTIELNKPYELSSLTFTSNEVHYYHWVYILQIQSSSNDITATSYTLKSDLFYSGFCELNISVCYYSCSNCTVFGNQNNHECVKCKKNYIRDPLDSNKCILLSDECSKFVEIEKYEYVCVECKYKIKKIFETDKETNITEVECYTKEEIDQSFGSIEDIEEKKDTLYELYPDTPLINLPNCTVEIIDSSQTNQGPNNASRINLGECENILRDHYGIPKGEHLVIVKIDMVVESQITNKVTYLIHRKNGTRLDISLCDDHPIEIKSPINNMSPELREKLEMFNSFGFDLYNKSDPFFNDRCIPFYSINDTDIPLKDRRKDLAQNSTLLCSADCNYNGLNLTDNTVICKCYSSEEASKPTKEEFINLLGSFLGVLEDSNFDVVTCFHLVVNLEIIKKNLGSWIVLGIISICVINSCYFIFFQMGTLFLIYYRIVIALNSQKVQPKTNPTRNKHQMNNKLSFSSVSEANNLNNNKNNEKNDQDPNINEIELKEEYQIEELNEMNFHDSIKYDNRNYLRMYLGFILMTQPFLDTFIYKSKKTLRSIKISMFFFGFVLDFSLSAFFYSDEYISNNYSNGGGIDFFDNLPVSLYTYLFGMVFSILLNFLSSPASLDKLTKIKDNDELLVKVNSFVTCYKIKLVFCFIFQLLFLCLFWYYVSAFCSVYQKSQINWLISGFTSLGLSMALPFAFSIILSLIRYISIRCKLKCLFCFISVIMIVIECV